MNVEIIDYLPEYQADFERLNKAWIEKYFVLEPHDKDVLEHPDRHIIDGGGAIIFARMSGELVGTVALMQEDGEPGVLEMTKMTVDERFRGKKIGLKLAESIIEKAKELGARKVVLYSQTALPAAINLYRKLGFTEVPVNNDKYARCDIKMELPL